MSLTDLAHRTLRWTDGAADAATGRRLDAVRMALLVHLAAETWVWAVEDPASPVEWQPWLAAGCGVALALGCVHRWRRPATAAAAALTGLQVLWNFPFNANHTVLLFLCLVLLALLDTRRPGEARLLLQSLRWLAILGLFHSGLQKVLYGTYFRGEYLAYLISLHERFSSVFGQLIPAAELERLTRIGDPVPGAGPYVVRSIPFLVLANLVYVTEMTLAVLLVPRRTRAFAATAAVG